MKKIYLFVAGIAAAGLLGVGAAPVAADPVPAAKEPSVAHPEQVAQVRRGTFWNRAACMAAGRKGVAEKRWSSFRCTQGYSLTVYWELWTDR